MSERVKRPAVKVFTAYPSHVGFEAFQTDEAEAYMDQCEADIAKQAQRIEELEEETLEYAAMVGEDANRIRELETALREIAKQRHSGEMSRDEEPGSYWNADFETGYDSIIARARAALATSREDSDADH